MWPMDSRTRLADDSLQVTIKDENNFQQPSCEKALH